MAWKGSAQNVPLWKYSTADNSQPRAVRPRFLSIGSLAEAIGGAVSSPVVRLHDSIQVPLHSMESIHASRWDLQQKQQK